MVAEKTAKNFTRLLYFAAPCRYSSWWQNNRIKNGRQKWKAKKFIIQKTCPTIHCSRSLQKLHETFQLTSWENIPGDCVSDGSEDPVQFTKHRATVIQQTLYSKQQCIAHVRLSPAATDHGQVAILFHWTVSCKLFTALVSHNYLQLCLNACITRLFWSETNSKSRRRQTLMPGARKCKKFSHNGKECYS